MKEQYSDIYPTDLGSAGYPGRDAIFISHGSTVTQAMSEAELPMEYYKSFSTSRVDPVRYFNNMTDISADDLMPCSDTVLANADEVSNYIRWIDDADGVVTSPSGTIAKCWQNSWWIAPACRSALEQCIPMITGGDGWCVNQMMIKAASYGMPLAIAVTANYAKYKSIPLEHKVVQYWWTPDDAFISNSPIEILFPSHNTLEWSQGFMRSSDKDGRLSKWAYRNLNTQEPKAE